MREPAAEASLACSVQSYSDITQLFQQNLRILTPSVSLHCIHVGDVAISSHKLGWRRGSVVRTSVFGWRTFLDLWLTCDHFVIKVSTMGQPTRPTQPSIRGRIMSSNACNHVITWITG